MKLISGPAPLELTDILSVLCRPRSKQDELARLAVEALGFEKVWIDAARLVATSHALGMRIYVIPGVLTAAGRARRAGSDEARTNAGVPVACLDIHETAGRVGPMAYTSQDILAGRMIRSYPLAQLDPRRDPSRIFFGIVPNCVEQVSIGMSSAHVAVAARDNYFECQISAAVSPGASPASLTWSMTWYDANGGELSTTTSTKREMGLLRQRVAVDDE